MIEPTRLRSGHCPENTGCGTQTACLCAALDDAASMTVSQFIGCWVEKMESGKWAICWPDCSYMKTGFGSKAAATATLNRYLYKESKP